MIEFISPENIEILKKIGQIADKTSTECYVVGGFVRDTYIGRDCKDIDIVVVENGIDFSKKVQEILKGSSYSFFKNYGTAQIIYKDLNIEFVGARKESYNFESRNPIVEKGTLKDDIDRRDLTINSLAIALNQLNFGNIIDFHNGINDIDNQVIRTPLEPDKTFSDDPLRMMRAIRFASQLGFDIEEETFNGIERNKDRISIISQERITDELNKIILSPIPSIGFKYLFETGLLKIIFPEFCLLHGVEMVNGLSHKDNFYHTLQVLDNLSLKSKDLWLRWAAILHDIAKPQTKKFEQGIGWTFHGHEDKGSRMVKPIFKRMRLPMNEKMRFVEKLVLLHLRPIVLAQEVVTDSAIRRLIVEAGEDLDSLMILCNSDITSKNEKKVEKIKQNFKIVEEKIKQVDEKDKLRNWQPPVTGFDILETFDINDKKLIGILKEAVREAILEGKIPDEKEKAMNFLKSKAMNLKIKEK